MAIPELPDWSQIRKLLTLSTPFQCVFYQGQWMAMPLPCCLSEANAEENCESGHSFFVEFPKACIVPYLLDDRKLQRLCQEQDISYRQVTGVSLPQNRKNEVRGRLDRKSSRVSGEIFRKFITFLSPQIRAMVELYWFINKCLKPIGLLYGWGELCFLRLEAMPEPSDHSPCVVNFWRTRRHGAKTEHFIAHYIPASLEKKIRKQISFLSPLLFCQKNGAPFTIPRLSKEFFKASKAAMEASAIQRSVLLRDLRDSITISDEELETISKKNRERVVHEISDSRLDEIQKLIQVAYRNAGAKSCFSLRSILQAILYHEEYGCAWSKLPLDKGFPPWKNVKSQHARWKDRKILAIILQAALRA